ncbi:MAG: YdiU family protein [Paracoccaceae bacterium]
MGIDFQNTYATELAGFYTAWQGDKAPAPALVMLNHSLADELGLDAAYLASPEGCAMLTGGTAPKGAAPLAMAYAGHQFGGFSPQLGDGRALLLGEIIAPNGARLDLHLKGTGRTPFARGGDGKAVLGPVLREYLMGEAMHALGIPTTRALAALSTGETINRDGAKPGAVLARVASSHIRVGTFQFFAARGEADKLRQLADYAIARHDPALKGDYLGFLAAVVTRQAKLVAQWMQVGFIHGVMNTDNMVISGETIDYGPCAFMDGYGPDVAFSSIDQHGRYAYGNQPVIAQWNLARLAECLLALIDPDTDTAIAKATDVVNGFMPHYQAAWLAGMRRKFGLAGEGDGDAALIEDVLAIMHAQRVDFTLFFRHLAKAAAGDDAPLRALFLAPDVLDGWLVRWQARLAPDASSAMNRTNPAYIPRNHLVEAALEAAVAHKDMTPFKTLLDVLADPFTEREGLESFTQPAPDGFGPFHTYCGT